jgi:hypothetical protein
MDATAIRTHSVVKRFHALADGSITVEHLSAIASHRSILHGT